MYWPLPRLRFFECTCPSSRRTTASDGSRSAVCGGCIARAINWDRVGGPILPHEVDYGSISLIAEPSRTATFHALELAKKAGALISYDPNWRPFLWRGPDHARQGILEGLAFADLVKLNETELEFITGCADFDSGSQWLLDRGVRLVVVTRGSGGSYFNDGRAKGFVTAFRVDKVDVTGCGDGFMAGLLASLLERDCDLEGLTGSDLCAILRFANAVGALTATRKGVIPALPTREAVEALLAANTPS